MHTTFAPILSERRAVSVSPTLTPHARIFPLSWSETSPLTKVSGAMSTLAGGLCKSSTSM